MKELTEQLRNHGLKKTPIRTSILQIFVDRKEALSQNQIENAMGDFYNRVSVYRALNDLESSGLIHRIHDAAGTSKFASCKSACSHQHHIDKHAHFCCVKCFSTFCLNEVVVSGIALPAGHVSQEISVLVKGLCQQCA
jgi:Fur family ferric uptake transcriptional regulator